MPFTRATSDAVAHAGLCAILLLAPFELLRPVVRLPGQSISDVELGLLIVFALWVASLLLARARPRWRTPLTAPWLALLAGLGMAALLARDDRANAVHMVCRGVAAFAVYLLTLNAVTTTTRLRRVFAAAGLAGMVVAILALLEYWQVRPVLSALRAFRPGVAVVGAQLRASGSLQYPTITSMYLEIVFAFGLGWLAFAVDARRAAQAAVGVVALALLIEAVVLTYSRAGLLTIALSLALVGFVRYRARGLDRLVLAVAALAAVAVAAVAASRSLQSIWLRLTTEGQAGWYRADIRAPGHLAFTTGEIEAIPLEVTNTGRVAWTSDADPPILLSYHWLEDGFDRVVRFEGLRTPFPAIVEPGATVHLRARVQAPPWPGPYRLDWDLVQEGRLWFSTEPGAIRRVSQASVTGQVFTGRLDARPLPLAAFRPGRLLLWRTAAAMVAAHPVAGVGPDNYRLLYGRYAGIPRADPRIHSNNMYLELLAGGGLLAALPLVWLLWRAGFLILGVVREAADPRRLPALGVAAAALAFGVHGGVDSFLSFTPTYTIAAITLGLLATAAHLEINGDAHRL